MFFMPTLNAFSLNTKVIHVTIAPLTCEWRYVINLLPPKDWDLFHNQFQNSLTLTKSYNPLTHIESYMNESIMIVDLSQMNS